MPTANVRLGRQVRRRGDLFDDCSDWAARDAPDDAADHRAANAREYVVDALLRRRRAPVDPGLHVGNVRVLAYRVLAFHRDA